MEGLTKALSHLISFFNVTEEMKSSIMDETDFDEAYSHKLYAQVIIAEAELEAAETALRKSFEVKT